MIHRLTNALINQLFLRNNLLICFVSSYNLERLSAMSSTPKQNSCTLPSKKSALKETVDLLRMQAKMQRMKVSRSAEELMNYCLENAQDDCLLQGIPTGGNPYKEGKNCPVM